MPDTRCTPSPLARETLRVLVVEDSEEVGRTIIRALRRSWDAEGEVVDTLPALLAELDRHPPAVVILDRHLPRLNYIAVLDELARRGLDIPVIGITGDPDDRMLGQMVEAGCCAAIRKPGLDLLAPLVRRALDDARARARLRELEADTHRIEHIAVEVARQILDAAPPVAEATTPWGLIGRYPRTAVSLAVLIVIVAAVIAVLSLADHAPSPSPAANGDALPAPVRGVLDAWGATP